MSFARNAKKEGLASALLKDVNETWIDVKYEISEFGKDLFFGGIALIATPYILYKIHQDNKKRREERE